MIVNRTKSNENLNGVTGGYIERHWGPFSENKIIDDITGEVLDTKYWLLDAMNRASELGVSTEFIDEDRTRAIKKIYYTYHQPPDHQPPVSPDSDNNVPY